EADLLDRGGLLGLRRIDLARGLEPLEVRGAVEVDALRRALEPRGPLAARSAEVDRDELHALPLGAVLRRVRPPELEDAELQAVRVERPDLPVVRERRSVRRLPAPRDLLPVLVEAHGIEEDVRARPLGVALGRREVVVGDELLGLLRARL